MKGKTLAEVKAKLMERPEFRAAYEAAEREEQQLAISSAKQHSDGHNSEQDDLPPDQ